MAVLRIYAAVVSEALPNAHGFSAQRLAALPPSSLDPAPGQMRVYVDGVLTVRPYDTTMEQP